MPANVETAAYANTPAWHREGVVIDTDGRKGMTIEEALPASGLDWEVEKVPAYAMFDGKPVKIEGRYAVQRTLDGRVFGTVGRTWEPVQNIEGFQLIDDLIQLAGGQGTPCWIESAMALDDGKKVVVMCHLDMNLQIAGEKYNSYLTFVNGHDGRTSVTAIAQDERIVCANTLAMGMYQAEKSGNIVRVRHTVNAADRIKEAIGILGMRNQQAEELAKQGEWLVEQEMSDAHFEKFIESLMPIEKPKTPAATMIQDRRDVVVDLYQNAATNAPIKGTRWGAFQSVVEYADHKREFKNTDTAVKAQLGIAATPLKDAAFMILQDKRLRPVDKLVAV